MRTLRHHGTAFLQVLVRGAACRLEVDVSLEHVQFRPALSHIKTEHRTDVRHVHLRSANTKTTRLRRNVCRQPSAAARSLARREEFEFGWPFDNDAGTAVEDDLRQTRVEP